MVVYLDMDGVLADIHKEIGFDKSDEEVKRIINQKGFYKSLKPTTIAHELVESLLGIKEIDLFIATKIPSGNTFAANEKICWVGEEFPWLQNKVFITPDKTKLRGDFLIDDDMRWSGFDGKFLLFDPLRPIDSKEMVLREIIKKMKL